MFQKRFYQQLFMSQAVLIQVLLPGNPCWEVVSRLPLEVRVQQLPQGVLREQLLMHQAVYVCIVGTIRKKIVFSEKKIRFVTLST